MCLFSKTNVLKIMMTGDGGAHAASVHRWRQNQLQWKFTETALNFLCSLKCFWVWINKDHLCNSSSISICIVINSVFIGRLTRSTMKMNLRMKKCWMKRGGPGSNWRYAVQLVCIWEGVWSCLCKTSRMPCLSICVEVILFVWSEFILPLPQVENTIRWRAKKDEEGNEARESNARIVKWSDGRCVWYRAECRVYYTLSRTRSVLSVLLNAFFPAAACPSTWGTKCSMFTKRLSRETTTTCSSVRALDCRDRLCSKPNSHSGNMPLLYWWQAAINTRVSHRLEAETSWVSRETRPLSGSLTTVPTLNKPQAASNSKQQQQ